MPKVKIQQSTNKSAQDAFGMISGLLEKDTDLRKLDPKYECNFDAASMSGSAKGSQFKADLKVTENSSGADVEIIVDLPFHLALAKGMVEKTLKKKLTEVLQA